MKIVLGHIVALTKGILLKPPKPGDHPWVQFIAGKKSSIGFRAGIGLSWWATEGTRIALNDVASLVVRERAEFKNCDLGTVERVVLDTLQGICLDNDIFDSEAVFAMRKNALFECHRLKVPDFADAVHRAIEANLRRGITRHCTVYVLPRFIIESFTLCNGSLHAIARNDSSAWETLVRSGYVFDGWSPSQPKQTGSDDLLFTPQGRMDCILAAEEHGTRDGAHFNSILRFRQLIAISYAVASERAPYPIPKSMADPPEFCIQFVHRDSSEKTLRRRDCRAMVPVYTEDILIGSEEVRAIKSWYRQLESLADDSRARAEKGAHFFNRGMNSDDIESFVNYFISLDAIFGERGAVEESILEGVRKLRADSSDVEKIPWLFDLRSELVHGGSRHVAEWPKYIRYKNHFRTEPAGDVRRIARAAVLEAPYLLGN